MDFQWSFHTNSVSVLLFSERSLHRRAISLVGLNKGVFQRWISSGFMEYSDETSFHDLVKYSLPSTLDELCEGYRVRQFAGHNFSARADCKWNFRSLGGFHCLLTCLFRAVCTQSGNSTDTFQCKPWCYIFSFDLLNSLPLMRKCEHRIVCY